jgi:predicted lipoprotein with Yx(FWY)xxD motif
MAGQTSDTFLKIKSSPVGDYITDKKGFSLYLFENDSPNKSKCEDKCERTFLPFLADDVTFPPDVDSRLESSKVGLFRRSNGKYQMTYNKVPLYKFKLDTSPEDRKGHKRKEFGGRWSVIKPDGTPMDSRIGSSMKVLENVKGVGLYSTGISKILVLPDLYTIRLNLTENSTDAIETFTKLRNNFNNISETILSIPGAETLKITPIEKKVNTELFVNLNENTSMLNTTNYLIGSQSYEIVSDDLKLIYAITNKLSELKNSQGDKLKYLINFSISPDNMNNAISLIYAQAIKDAFENANIMLDPLNLTVDGEYPIKSINVESLETVPLNNLDPELKNLVVLNKNSNLNAMMVTLRAIVAYNINKKRS